jgi:hypothetical protein
MPLNIPEDRNPSPTFNPGIRCFLTVFQFLNVCGVDRSREKRGHGRKRSGRCPVQCGAHLRQECHNSKFGILELLVQKETFADALLTCVVSQRSLKNSPLESSCIVVAFIENYSASKPLNVSPEKSQILSCDTFVANERYVELFDSYRFFTSCRLAYRINVVHSTDCTLGAIVEGTNKWYLSNKIRDLYYSHTYIMLNTSVLIRILFGCWLDLAFTIYSCTRGI